jgi:hypothetical protein
MGLFFRQPHVVYHALAQMNQLVHLNVVVYLLIFFLGGGGGGGKGDRKRGALPASCISKGHGGVLLVVWSLEGKVVGLGEVQAGPCDLGAGHALRPGHGVQNRQPHVWPAQLHSHPPHHLSVSKTRMPFCRKQLFSVGRYVSFWGCVCVRARASTRVCVCVCVRARAPPRAYACLCVAVHTRACGSPGEGI